MKIKALIVATFLILVWLFAHAQSSPTTPYISLNIPSHDAASWDVLLNANFSKLDSIFHGDIEVPKIHAQVVEFGAMQGDGPGVSLGSQTSANTDLVGVLALSSGSATLTFGGTYSSSPVCITKDETNPANPTSEAITSTALTVTGTGTDSVGYICIFRN